MKNKNVLPVVLICVGLFTACKKKSLPEAEPGNDPQFYFKGNVNGSFTLMEAGVNDYYMYSSYSQNSIKPLKKIDDEQADKWADRGGKSKI